MNAIVLKLCLKYVEMIVFNNGKNKPKKDTRQILKNIIYNLFLHCENVKTIEVYKVGKYEYYWKFNGVDFCYGPKNKEELNSFLVESGIRKKEYLFLKATINLINLNDKEFFYSRDEFVFNNEFYNINHKLSAKNRQFIGTHEEDLELKELRKQTISMLFNRYPELMEIKLNIFNTTTILKSIVSIKSEEYPCLNFSQTDESECKKFLEKNENPFSLENLEDISCVVNNLRFFKEKGLVILKKNDFI